MAGGLRHSLSTRLRRHPFRWDTNSGGDRLVVCLCSWHNVGRRNHAFAVEVLPESSCHVVPVEVAGRAEEEAIATVSGRVQCARNKSRDPFNVQVGAVVNVGDGPVLSTRRVSVNPWSIQ
jgi:hypothetical protein